MSLLDHFIIVELEATFENGLFNSGDPLIYVNCPVHVSTPKKRVWADCNLGRNSQCSNVHLLHKDDPDRSGSKRCESSTKNMKNAVIRPRTWYYYGFSIYIPSDWIDDTQSEILFQWKGGSGGKPFIGLHSKNTEFYININTNTDPNFDPKEDKHLLKKRKHSITDNFVKGKWHDFLFNVTWDFNSPGIAQLFVEYKTEDDDDYETVVYDNQTNMYNAEGYAKWGVYKPGWKKHPDRSMVTTRKVIHDNIRIGYNREVVDPSINR